MATIKLYAGKVSQMSSLLGDVKKSVSDYQSELFSLKAKTLKINSSVCNVDDVVRSIQASTQTQDLKIASLDTLQKDTEQFISDVLRTDNEVADVINRRKDEFYTEYTHLKPDSEKSFWEKSKDIMAGFAQWCQDNWKSIGKIILAAVLIAALGILATFATGFLAIVLTGAFWGALSGAIIGGVMGGITSMINGGSFLQGFADGALGGAISGALTGAAFAGIGALGAAIGKSIHCLTTVGKVVTTISKVTKVISLTMSGFDMVSMVWGAFDSNNPLTTLNQKLHSNKYYNVFQIGVSALAVFTAGATSTMKCFVAGTMVLTAGGVIAIENIKVGNKVTSTSEESFEVAEKKVVETYIRETKELVHLTINGEMISTTYEHPFYVKERGFVSAGELVVGDELVDTKGNVLVVEDSNLELLDDAVKVYNFQVADFHTYHVGNHGVLVHNADYKGANVRTVEVNGKQVTMDDSLFDPNQVDKFGRTNIERMQEGLAPIGIDGKSVNLHHVDQTPNGPIQEILKSDHTGNYSNLHSNTGQSPSQIDRNAFRKWRESYWEWRINNLK